MNFFHSKLGGPTDGQALGEKNKLWEGPGILRISTTTSTSQLVVVVPVHSLLHCTTGTTPVVVLELWMEYM
jgi:hypothetical protein